MVSTSFVRFLVLSLLWRVAHGISADHECDACAFWQHDLPDCKVYGQLHTGGIVAFYRANEKCLLYYNIRVQNIDADRVASIFPTTDGKDGDLNEFMQFLQDDVNATKGAVHDYKLTLKDFFVPESDDFEVRAVFKDSIMLGATQYDCTAHHGRDCWTAMREYFGLTTEGKKHMQQAGKLFWLEVQLDGEMEQKSARVAICADNEPPAVCGPLKEQILEIWEGNPEMDCSLFGLGKGGFHSSQINCYPNEEVPGKSVAYGVKAATWVLFLAASIVALLL